MVHSYLLEWPVDSFMISSVHRVPISTNRLVEDGCLIVVDAIVHFEVNITNSECFDRWS